MTKLQLSLGDIDEDYKNFVDKFKPKKTTDDCYTPENIYQAILDWSSKRYGFDKGKAIRPFWPGGDYETLDYPEGCVVVDNPPFSILSKIINFYSLHGIDYFLFAPALTLFTSPKSNANYLPTGADIVYENGATVNTSFVTSLGEYRIECNPEFYDVVKIANNENLKCQKKSLRKMEFPIEVATSARLQWLTVHHTPFFVKKTDCVYVRGINQNPDIFGGAFILSERAAAERAAAERAAAERAAAERYQLTKEEKAFQQKIGK